MGCGGSLPTLEEFINETGNAAVNVSSGGTVGFKDGKFQEGELVKDAIRESKPYYDELTGENARKKDQSEKDAEKDVARSIVKSKAKKKEADTLEGERDDAKKQRSGSLRRQSQKKKRGRRSTILTDNLGSLGGEENQGKKSLLGL